MAKGGGGKGATGSRYQTYLGINPQETGGGSGVGEPTANIRGICERDGMREKGEVAREVMAIIVMGEGRKGDGFLRYDGTETGDARVRR